MSDTPPPAPDAKAANHSRRLAWFKALSPVLMILVTAGASFFGVEGYQARSRKHELELQDKAKQRELEVRANDALANRHNDIINRYLGYHDDAGEKRLALARFMAHTGRDGIRVWAQAEVQRLQDALDQRDEAKHKADEARQQIEALNSKLAEVRASAQEDANTLNNLRAKRAAAEGRLAQERAKIDLLQGQFATEHSFALLQPLYDRESGELTSADVFERLRNRASSSRVHWNGVDLQELDLSGIHLKRALLKRADLDNTRLVGANFAGAYLLAATLDKADLTQADLHHASLARAYLRGANFTRANLTRARLNDAFARGAAFNEADLRHADLSGADLRDAVFTGADLRDANLTDTQLAGATLTGAVAPAAGVRALPEPVRSRWKTCGNDAEARFHPADSRCPRAVRPPEGR